VLAAMAYVAVAFFIVMTSWGWFSGPDQMNLRVILGGIQTVVVLPLLIPFTAPRSNARKLVYAGCTGAILVLVAAAYRETFG
jgi:hypothetical protein